MASLGGDIGSLLIFSATGDGDRGALGGRWPVFGTVKWDKDLQERNTLATLPTVSSLEFPIRFPQQSIWSWTYIESIINQSCQSHVIIIMTSVDERLTLSVNCLTGDWCGERCR